MAGTIHGPGAVVTIPPGDLLEQARAAGMIEPAADDEDLDQVDAPEDLDQVDAPEDLDQVNAPEDLDQVETDPPAAKTRRRKQAD